MSKPINNLSRLGCQLQRMFKALNHDFFNDELETPMINIIPTAKAYAHVSVEPIWQCGKDIKRRELNVSSAYLDRPLEYICASILHEAAHLLNLQHNIADVSRGQTYHNRQFKITAESHGLICRKTEKYGYSDTSSTLSDELLDWVLLHDEFNEIELCRATPGLMAIGVGSKTADGSAPTTTATKSNSIRWHCPGCGAIVRSTKPVKLICGDCITPFVLG